MEAELTTVADDEAVVHIGGEVRRYLGLDAGTDYVLDGVHAHTLPRPGGQLLSTIATVNDVHFGETECGVVEGGDIGPVLSVEPGEQPYPEVMNTAAIAEIGRLTPDVVIAKGDLTAHGTAEEYAMFLARYEVAFGAALRHVRGNHDASHGETFAAFPTQEVRLPGVIAAIIDTTVPMHHGGRVTTDQLEWLDDLLGQADRPVLVFGHHHPWDPDSRQRPDDYFGINPADSEALVAVLRRHDRFAGYFAGHTHRNRVRRFRRLDGKPVVEVASVKDFPGCWAEYRVYEGGILQIDRRISSRAALSWTDRTRAMYFGHYADYSFGQLTDRCFALPSVVQMVARAS